jgi:predicted dinucleotide-utilizing enzyme
VTGSANGVVELATGRNGSNGQALSAETTSYNKPRGLTAAAKRMNLGSEEDMREMSDRPYVVWQDEAWAYHDSVGEINYGHEMVAAIMSRLRLYAAVVIDPDAPPSSVSQLQRRQTEQSEDESELIERAGMDFPEDLTEEVQQYMQQVVADLGSGYGGIAGLLRAFTLNALVPGEMYLARIDNRWSIRSTTEINVRPGMKKALLQESRIVRTPSGMPRELPENTYIARIWRPHPRFSKEPTSSMIALRESCDELLTLQRMIRGVARSRMNAGVFFIPDTMRVAGSSVNEDKEESEDDIDVFIDEFFDAITTPITDETAGTSAVPMVVTGPKDDGEAIKLISVSRESDRFLVERTDKVLERILSGLYIPKEKVSGLDQVQYSNADQVSEDLYRIHIEPLAVMLCDAVTSVYMRVRVKKKFPNLSAATLGRLAIWYDPSAISIKSDPSESASEGYKEHILSAAAWRRANGYSDTDAPSQAELALRMVVESTGRNLPPEVQFQVLQVALPELFGEAGPFAAPAPAAEAPRDDRYGPGDAVSAEVNGRDAESARAEVTT